MKFIFCIIALVISTICLAIEGQEKVLKSRDSITVKSDSVAFPKVEVKIALENASLKSGDKILLNIILTNVSSTNQRLLFDKPVPTTNGPWFTSATVIDLKSDKTVLKYQNKGILSSETYTEEQLEDYYHILAPNESISKEYELSDIVVFNTNDKELPKGNYKVQVLYCNNFSNVITVTIE